MVLHNVADDAEFVKVTAASFGAEWLLESDENTSDTLSIPGRSEESITETQDHEILNHFFTEIVIDSVDLIFTEKVGQMRRKSGR